MAHTKTRCMIYSVIGGFILLLLLATAIVVPVMFSLMQSQGNAATTGINTTTAGTITTTAVSFRWNGTGLTIAGSSAGTPGNSTSLLYRQAGLTFDTSNALYITDSGNNRIQKWVVGASSGATVAGQASGISGNSTTALNNPNNIILDSSNNMYFTDRDNCRVMYWANGASSGSVIFGTSGICGANTSLLQDPNGLVRDSATGTIYVADGLNHRIISFSSGATIGTVVAGGNGGGSSSNQLNYPYCLVIDTSTNSFIITNAYANTVVRWVMGASSWTLLAGSPGVSGSSSTLLNAPTGLQFDSYGNLYVVDTYNNRVQFFLSGQSNGTTIAGISGSHGLSATQLYNPVGVLLDSQLNVYVADTLNNRVQKFFRY